MSRETGQAMEDGADGPLVVGHDGSSGADAALAAALDLATHLGAHVEVVRSWTIDTAPPGAIFVEGYAAPLTDVDEVVRARLEKDSAAIVARYPGVAVSYRGVLGHAAEVLLRSAHPARMLIVGSRGRGGFASLLLGSVSDQCVRHAACPVLVVPAVSSPRQGVRRSAP
ncbi:universal stress protein [Labedella endophytica]|uniref:Universal stress protein n=1 Tax=Labedella endophytica TaxID=1523160 RepID=A0A433JVU2_9MICO|nr:universal stress protein [Labedella endophytica]RUR03260.1 universal stress protein [Labedella endophytica]